MNDACSGCSMDDTYMVHYIDMDSYEYRCRKEDTCEKFQRAREIKMEKTYDAHMSVEEYKKSILRSINIGINATSINDDYGAGMVNGMKYCKALVDGEEPEYVNCPEKVKKARERFDMVDSWAYAAKVSKYLDKEKEEKEKDNVNHPSHYADGCSLECIDIMEVIFGPELVFDYAIVNAFKYLWRYKNKNGQEDIEKAKWYLDKAHELDKKEDFVGSRRVKYWKVQELYAKVIYKEKGKEDGEVQ